MEFTADDLHALLAKEHFMSLYVEKAELAVGIFDSRDKAEAAIAELEAAGFAAEDIGIAARDRPSDDR